MNVIFLDIDGPLIPGTNDSILELTQCTPYPIFDSSAVRYLRLLAEYSAAKIVFSTSWTLVYSYNELRGFMDFNDLELDWHDEYETPKKLTGQCRRHEEILAWLKKHHESIGSDRFLVIDDNSLCQHIRQGIIDMDIPVKGDWVPVEYEIGFTYENFLQGCQVFGIEVDEVSLNR